MLDSTTTIDVALEGVSCLCGALLPCNCLLDFERKPTQKERDYATSLERMIQSPTAFA